MQIFWKKCYMMPGNRSRSPPFESLMQSNFFVPSLHICFQKLLLRVSVLFYTSKSCDGKFNMYNSSLLNTSVYLQIWNLSFIQKCKKLLPSLQQLCVWTWLLLWSLDIKITTLGSRRFPTNSHNHVIRLWLWSQLSPRLNKAASSGLILRSL